MNFLFVLESVWVIISEFFDVPPELPEKKETPTLRKSSHLASSCEMFLYFWKKGIRREHFVLLIGVVLVERLCFYVVVIVVLRVVIVLIFLVVVNLVIVVVALILLVSLLGILIVILIVFIVLQLHWGMTLLVFLWIVHEEFMKKYYGFDTLKFSVRMSSP